MNDTALPLSLIALLALAVGTMMGLLGGGGSILAVPIFVYLCHIPPKLAIASSLVVVAFTASVGAIPHYRSDNVDVRRAVLFALLSSAGAFAGTRLSVLLSGDAQLLLFAFVMGIAAFFMLRPARITTSQRDVKQASDGTSGRTVLTTASVGTSSIKTSFVRTSFVKTSAPAFLVGCMTGLVGVGGGFMIVPVLTVTTGMDMRRAVGTSLVVIALNSFVGAAGYAMQEEIASLYYMTAIGAMTMHQFLLVFMACTFTGVMLGARLSARVSEQALKRGFGLLLVAVAGFIIMQKTLLDVH